MKKMHAGDIIDPHSSLNVALKHDIFPCNYFCKSQKSIFQQFRRFVCTVSSRISVGDKVNEVIANSQNQHRESSGTYEALVGGSMLPAPFDILPHSP